MEGGCLGLHMWQLEIKSMCLLQSLTSVLFWGHGLSLNLNLLIHLLVDQQAAGVC